MDQRLALPLLLLGLCALITLCARLLFSRFRGAVPLTARLRDIRAGPLHTAGNLRRSETVRAAAALGALLMHNRLLPHKTLHEVRMMLASANLRGETIVAGFVGGKVLLLLGLPPLAWLLASLAGRPGYVVVLAALGGAAVALLVPDLLLGRRRRRRIAAITGGLPDALDLLVICVDAGLAFEQALERVTREIIPVHPELAEELAVTVNELRISPDRRTVLMDMGARLDVDFLRQLATTLAQSLQLGAPLSQALRQLAQELRREQIIRIEARAARLPVLLTIPMVIFIMPTVLLVVCGPAVVQIIRAF